jgi:hypothetical protein
MWYFICLFAILFNFNFISYNEIFLLGLFLIIFFYLIYIFLEIKIKEYIFFQIYKIYCLIFFVLKLSNFFQKLSIYFYVTKKRLLKKIDIKIKSIKKSIILSISILFENYLVIFFFLFYLNINKIFKLLSNSSNILLIFANNKANINDSLLFY